MHDRQVTKHSMGEAVTTATNVIQIEDLATRLQRGQRLLGLDLGTKTIGLALSDVERRFATPMTTIRRTKFTQDVSELRKYVEQQGVAALAFGWPLNMDGSAGPRVQSTQAFIRNIAPLLPLPVVLWDERLSTVAAERTLLEADLSRNKRAAVIDATAAAFILQGVLDRLRFLNSADQRSTPVP